MKNWIRIISLLFPLLIFTTGNAATYLVSSNANAGANTLRQAILDANANGGADNIDFNFGVATTITLTACLPQITGQTTINGYSDPGASAGNLMIEVISPAGCNGFEFAAGSNGSTIRGLIISGGTNGVYLNGSSNHTVSGNYLSTNAAGTGMAASRLQNGINLNASNNNIIGGTGGAIDRNIISGATQDGIRIVNSTGTVIIGNYIGTTVSGNAALGNGQHGIEGYTNSHNTRVGGTTTNERNVISSNGGNGLYLNGCQSPIVKGNIFGMGVDGTTKLGNTSSGIDIQNTAAGPAQIGGLTVAERNYSSCNGSFGIVIRFANNSVIQGNWLGVDMTTGLLDYGNYDAAITVTNTADVIVGGAVAGAGNICSASGNPGGGADGISIWQTSPRPIIKGNIIGLGVDGVTPLQNYGHGIECLTCDDGIIGGTTLLERNLVSCSFNRGLQLVNSPRVTVINNYIGTDVTGLLDRGGTEMGISVSNSANVVIGGTAANTGNIISGNAFTGIEVTGNSPSVIIKGNYIGLGSDGVTSIRNDQGGIKISGNQTGGSVIGGNTVQERNLISANGTGNSHHGIYIDGGSTIHSIVNNYIGTDITGTLAKGNAGSGIQINNVSNVTVDGNIASANGAWGMQFINSSTNTIIRNLIGTDVSGGNNLGNTSEGLRFSATALNNIAGGTLANANTIAYNNGTAGVLIESTGQRNTITFNSIFCNAGLGIDLLSTANESVLPPVILFSGTNSANGTGVDGNTVHLYRNARADGGVKCNCEGEIYLGNTVVAGGVWTITHNLGLTASEAASVTATQTTPTAPTGSTSEFTACTMPLPVSYLSFDVSKQAGHTVFIEWSTINEVNNLQFEIQRSVDGIHFFTIGSAKGNGTSELLHGYSFVDENPSIGINYYRLKQVDLNGGIAFSEVKSLDFSSRTIAVVSAPEGIKILSAGKPAQYRVHSLTGCLLMEGKITDPEQLLPMHVSEGIYLVSVFSNEERVTEKVVVK